MENIKLRCHGCNNCFQLKETVSVEELVLNGLTEQNAIDLITKRNAYLQTLTKTPMDFDALVGFKKIERVIVEHSDGYSKEAFNFLGLALPDLCIECRGKKNEVAEALKENKNLLKITNRRPRF